MHMSIDDLIDLIDQLIPKEVNQIIIEHSRVRGQTSQFIGLCKQSISDQLKQIGYLGQSVFQ